MDHLKTISDIAVRDAVDVYQTAMERLVVRLLGDNDPNALAAFLEDSRQRALNHVKNNLRSELRDIKSETRALTLAIAMVEKTFDRLAEPE